MRGTNARMPTNRRPRLARVPVLFDNSTMPRPNNIFNSHEDCTFTQYCGSTDPEGCCDYCFCFVCNQPAKDRPEWGDKGDHHRVCEKKWQMRRKKWAAAHRLLRHSPTLNRQVTVTRYRTRETTKPAGSVFLPPLPPTSLTLSLPPLKPLLLILNTLLPAPLARSALTSILGLLCPLVAPAFSTLPP
jgi:hypothetical protein